MLTNYARWYSFTPPQWPTLSPPLTEMAFRHLFGAKQQVDKGIVAS